MIANRSTTWGRRAALMLAGLAGLALAAACSTATTDDGSPDGGAAPANTTLPTSPIADRPVPTDKVPSGPVKIAIIGFSNNPYWVNVKQGVDSANAVLKSHNGQVDWVVAGNSIDVPTVNAAVQASGSQGYNGIGFFIAGDGNCPVIKDLSGKGIAVGVYNTLVDCVATSGGAMAYAQQQYDAGINSAKQLITATGGATGEVGVITSQFTAPGAEQRRNGFLDGLKGSNITAISKGVEAHDSASETFTAAQNYLQSSPNLLGIYCTAGGPFGAAQAVKAANKASQVKVIGYDITTENIAAIKDGSMFGVTGQDAFGQGYNLAVTLFNTYVTGTKPTNVMVNAESPFVTKDNLAQHDPATQPVGTLGTS